MLLVILFAITLTAQVNILKDYNTTNFAAATKNLKEKYSFFR